MNVDLGIWGKLTRVAIFLLLAACILGVAVWYLPLIRTNERMRQRILVLDQNYEKEKELNKQLRTSLEALQNDPKAVERLAREKLGYARPGEIVIRFEPPATNRIAH